MKRIVTVVACLGLWACGPGVELGVGDDLTTSTTSSLTAVTSFGPNPGALNMYKYVPANMPANAPLVVAMHGCTQTAADYTNVGWNALADKYKFYVLYPEQTTSNNQLRCFNWGGEFGDPTNIKRGQGENESIKEMIDQMKTDHSIDSSRVFVTGFSGGGAQTSLMMAVWPEVFAAGATVAGIPYNCTTTFSEVSGCLKPGKTLSEQEWGDRVRAANPNYTGKYPRVAIWQGTADSVVDPNNTTQMLRQWSNVHGIDETADVTDTSVNKATRREFKDGQGNTLIEVWGISGMDHGAAIDSANGCGTAAQYVLNVGICSSFYIAKFFGITGATPPPVDAGQPDAGPVDAGKPDAGQPDAGKPDAGQPDAGKPDAGQPDAGPVDAGKPDAGPVDAGQSDAGPGSCQQTTDTTYNLVASGKAVRCGSWLMYACAGGTQLGFWNVFVQATVHTTDGSTWLAGKCP